MTYLERVLKSKKMFLSPPIHKHRLVEIRGTDGFVECLVCGGTEGTLLKNCPGFDCAEALGHFYFDDNCVEISHHWAIMIFKEIRKRNFELVEIMRDSF